MNRDQNLRCESFPDPHISMAFSEVNDSSWNATTYYLFIYFITYHASTEPSHTVRFTVN